MTTDARYDTLLPTEKARADAFVASHGAACAGASYVTTSSLAASGLRMVLTCIACGARADVTDETASTPPPGTTERRPRGQ